MRLNLSPMVSRFVAVGLLFAIPLILWSVIVAPLVSSEQEAKDSIEHLQPMLDRSHAVELELASLQSEVKQASERRISAGGFLVGPNESIAAAQLQNQLKVAIEGAGGELRSIQVLSARDASTFRQVSVRGQMLMDLTALRLAVYNLEKSIPYVFIDNIEITERPDDRTHKIVTNDPLLDVRFDLSGYMRRAS